MMGDLRQKIEHMSVYLEDDAIAEVLRITPEMVRDIRSGVAEVKEVPSSGQHAPIIQVGSVKTSYRQKVVSVFRAKGGVGGTFFAICLAYSLSQEVSTLLLDFNFSLGGSDVSYYLGLPLFPDISQFNGKVVDCVTEIEPNFHVVQSSLRDIERTRDLTDLIRLARGDYDAIIIDLPNITQEWVSDVLGASTSIIAFTGGLEIEAARLESILGRYSQKDIFVALNLCHASKIKEAPSGYTVIEVPYDPSITKHFNNGELPSEKSPFMRSVARAKDLIFDREKKNILSALFGR